MANNMIVLEGQDFSNLPNAIDLNSLPAVKDKLVGIYTGEGSPVDGNTQVITMPSTKVVTGPTLQRIGSTAPVFPFEDSSVWKGDVIYSANKDTNASVNGLKTMMDIDLTEGVTFTFFLSLFTPSTSSTTRTLLSFESIFMQFRSSQVSGSGHLQFGSAPDPVVYKDLGFHGYPAGEAMVISLVITKNEARLYGNGALLGTASLTDLSLPDTLSTNVTFFSNWAGTAGTVRSQYKQFQIHKKALSLAEVQRIHAALPDLVL